MTKPRNFILRAETEVRKHDEMLGQLTFGDHERELFREWNIHGGTAHIYVRHGGWLMARGTASEKAYASGFISGWKRRMADSVLVESITGEK